MKFVLFVTLWSALINSQEMQKSHYNGDRFQNPWVTHSKGFRDFLKWQWTRQRPEWPEKVTYNTLDRDQFQELKPHELEIYFIHHATYLIRIGNVNIITDPVFSTRASPVEFAGPKRVHDLAITIEEMPKIDVVLISHNHYDHLDLNSLKLIKKEFDPLFVVPLKNGPLLESIQISKIQQMDWWDRLQIEGSEIAITLTPALHWSARGIFDRNKALWGGFSLHKKEEHLVYFAGDTGYAPFFIDIRERLGSPRVSLLPIGASEPRWFMQEYHMNAQDAIQAYKDLKTQQAVAAHWGSFNLSDELIDQPKLSLAKELAKEENQHIKFEALVPGTKVQLAPPTQ